MADVHGATPGEDLVWATGSPADLVTWDAVTTPTHHRDPPPRLAARLVRPTRVTVASGHCVPVVFDLTTVDTLLATLAIPLPAAASD